MSIYVASIIALLAGYMSHWLSLTTPDMPLLRPFLGCASYESLRSKGRLWFWSWVVTLVANLANGLGTHRCSVSAPRSFGCFCRRETARLPGSKWTRTDATCLTSGS